MPTLDARTRAGLPDSAFAYIDSKGRRRLPINDRAHVKNALSRFNQTTFEDEPARDRARARLLRAARKYGIVPVGFMTGQLVNLRVRAAARVGEERDLPTGVVTFLLADVEDSTGLLRALGDRYGSMLTDLRRILGAEVRACDGRVVDIRADELFAVFKRAPDALRAAVGIQRTTLGRTWPRNASIRIRIGLHTGRPKLTESGYVGLAVHMAARVCDAARGGQILLSHAAHEACAGAKPAGIAFRDIGPHTLQGIPSPEVLFQVEDADPPRL